MTTYSGRVLWDELATRWPLAPLKAVAKIGTGHTPSRSHPEYWQDCTIPWVTTEDLTSRTDGGLRPLMDTRQKISEVGMAHSAAVLHPAETVMLSRTASVGHVVRIGRPMATTQAFVTWTCGPHLDPRYLTLVLNAMRPEFARIAYGSTHLTIYMPDLEQLRVPIPPLPVQQAVADFLDVETARIDALIAKKRDLLQRLSAARMVVMTDGLRGRFVGGSTQTRHSALPWLDECPASWPDVKLTYVARLGSGHTPSRLHPEWWTDCTIPWITTGEVAQLRSDRIEFISETREKISQVGLENSAAELHPADTVVLCRTAASAGYSGIMAAPMATSQDFAAWRCGPLLRPRFLLTCLRAMRQDLLGRLATGSTHKTIYMPDLEALRVPLPPVEDQDRVVDEVWKRLGWLDEASDRLASQLSLLAEHRQALITAAVTGELMVPGADA
jgi:type I restriction enzyme S subunit